MRRSGALAWGLFGALFGCEPAAPEPGAPPLSVDAGPPPECRPDPQAGPAACAGCDPATGRVPLCGPGEAAVPSQGCVPVGASCPAWMEGGVCRPGTCPPGQRVDLALGCVAVGPAVCDPAWLRDGICRPAPDACPGGAPIPAGCLTPADPAGCPAGAFGAAPEGLAQGPAVYVDPLAAPGGEGSEARPFASLAEALAGPGPRTVYLAAGVYPPVSLPDGVSLVGRCAADTRLEAQGAAAALTVPFGHEGAVAGLQLRAAEGLGLRVEGALTAHGVLITSRHRGAEVAGAPARAQQARLTLVESVISGAEGLADGIVAHTAEVSLERSAIVDPTRDAAVVAAGTLALRESFMGGRRGGRVVIGDGAAAQVLDSVLGGYAGAALRLAAASHEVAPSAAALVRSVVWQSQARPTGPGESGLSVGAGGQLTVHDSALVANPASHLVVQGADAVGTVEGSLLVDALAVAGAGGTGAGALASEGGRLTVRASEVRGGSAAGLGAAFGGALEVEACLIRGNGAGEAAVEGLGGVVFGKGPGTVVDSVFQDNLRRGVLVLDSPPGEAVAVRRCSFLQAPGDDPRLAVEVLNGAARVAESLVIASRAVGFGGRRARLALDRVAIRGFECLPLDGRLVGAAVLAEDSQVVLAGVDLGPGCGGAVQVKYTAPDRGSLSVSDSLFHDLSPPADDSSAGAVYALGPGPLTARDLVIQDLIAAGGIGIAGGGALDAARIRVVGVRADPLVGGGHGLWASEAAASRLDALELRDTRVAGIAWFDSAPLQVTGSRIEGVDADWFFNQSEVLVEGAGHGIYIAGEGGEVSQTVVAGVAQVGVAALEGAVDLSCVDLSAGLSCVMNAEGGAVRWTPPAGADCPQAVSEDLPRAPVPPDVVLPP